MQFYHELDLPSNPLKNNNALELVFGYKQREPNSYLTKIGPEELAQVVSKELLDIFKQIRCPVQYAILFGSCLTQSANSAIHTDVYWDHKQTKWNTISAGVSYELTPGDTTFHWINSTGLTEHWPDHTKENLMFNGVFFGGKKFADAEQDKWAELQRYTFKPGVPILAKTDIPHYVKYSTSAKFRVGLSLRFHPWAFTTWEKAVERFKPIMINS